MSWLENHKKTPTNFPLLDVTEGVEEPVNLVYNPNNSLSIDDQRKRLPIFEYRTSILYCLEKYRILIIIGETGCGKTTQIPQYLFEAGWHNNFAHCIACTQPRRISAVSVAQRVAEEKKVKLGTMVGYSIQFDAMFDEEKTKIKYMTDGMLLREMMMDPLLSNYSVIMIDEAHERSLYTDIILGLLKKIMKKRSDLRLIISSATIEAELFKSFFEKNFTLTGSDIQMCTILSVPGRQYPVEIHYVTEPVNDYVNFSVSTVLDIIKTDIAQNLNNGILVFLTGQEEIDNFIKILTDEALRYGYSDAMIILPLYSGLPMEEQMKVFEPIEGSNLTKVIASTNIAETSVTIEGISYVIDCGFVKQRVYNPRTRMESLIATEISQSSARQRAGRAGRVRPGKCYRLYTEEAYINALKPYSIPEIQRTNLTNVILQLKALGIDNIMNFDFISQPTATNMARSLEFLFALGALDEDCKLTQPLGVRMAEFPVDAKLSKMLLCSGQYRCSEEILTIASLMSVQSIFVLTQNVQRRVEKVKQKFAVIEGDHLSLLNVYYTFLKAKNQQQWCYDNFINFKSLRRAVHIREQLKKYLYKFSIPLISCYKEAHNRQVENSKKKRSKQDSVQSGVDANEEDDPTVRIRKCILSGYFAHVAHRQSDGSYSTLSNTPEQTNQKLYIHPSSVLFKYPPEWLVYSEVVQTTHFYMRDVMKLDPKWLPQIAPHYYEVKRKKIS